MFLGIPAFLLRLDETPFWIERLAHPEDWMPAFLVGAGVVVGASVLLRVIFAGGRRQAPAALPRKRFGNVVVPVDGKEVSEEAFLRDAVPLACTLSNPEGAVDLAYIIRVPRAYAVTAELPEEEKEARRVLDRAARIVAARGLRANLHVQKGRTFVDETLRVLQEAKAEVLVLALPDAEVGQEDCARPIERIRMDGSDGSLGCDGEQPATLELGECDTYQTTLGRILRRAPCEVIFARPAPGQIAPAPVSAAAVA